MVGAASFILSAPRPRLGCVTEARARRVRSVITCGACPNPAMSRPASWRRSIRTSSCCSVLPVTWPSASSCPVCCTCTVPACCRPAGSSARRSTTSTTSRSGTLAEKACVEYASRTVTPRAVGGVRGRRCASFHRPTAPLGCARPLKQAEDELGTRRPPPPLPQRAARIGALGRPDARRRRPRRPIADHHGEAVRNRPARAPSRLNARLHETFEDRQIFRIDHFLGKEAAQNILAFRFANGLFEPIWNRDHIDHVQIDVPETLALENRIGFYESDRRVPRHGRHPPVPGAGVHGDGAADGAGPDGRSPRRRTRSSAR